MGRGGQGSLYAGRGPALEHLPPMVLVHAAGGSGRNFFSLLRHLPPQAIAFDQPGHGAADGLAPSSLEQGAVNVLAVAEQLFGERAKETRQVAREAWDAPGWPMRGV